MSLEQARLFIGSSSESLEIARAIFSELDHDCYPEIWTQIFNLSENTLVDLINQADKSDFAVFVFSPDDITTIRKTTSSTVRDNVIFELGLFMGKLGKERVYFVVPKGSKLHLPTDLLGINYGNYFPDRDNLKSAVATFCNEIRTKIKTLGKVSKKKFNTGVSFETQSHIKEESFNNTSSVKAGDFNKADSDKLIPKVKKTPTDKQKREYLESSFNKVKSFFADNLKILQDNDKDISTDIYDIENNNFVCEIYVQGNLKAQIKIWLGNNFHSQGIYLSTSINSFGNSYNGWFSPKHDGYEFYFESILTSTSDKLLTDEKLCLILWKELTKQL